MLNTEALLIFISNLIAQNLQLQQELAEARKQADHAAE